MEQALLPTEKIEKSIATSPAQMMSEALARGASLDQLDKLIGLQERWEANEAKKLYHKAMAAFKATPPKIDKDMTVKYGSTSYKHASLFNVTEKINEALSHHGLSASWTINQNGAVSVTCKITHEAGYSEETTMTAPADNTGSKNAIQAIGSTVTYLQRYTLLSLTGLATHDQDDDALGAGIPTERISEEEAGRIMDAMLELGEELYAKFCKYMKVKEVSDILASDAKKAWLAIENAKKSKAAKK